ncbi:stalk domain-containing protein [Bacillus tianshenii]|nr:stalk domain-containing protein [Bacillus tianshenii]
MKRIFLALIGAAVFLAPTQTGYAQEIHRLTLPLGTKQIYHDSSYSISQEKHLVKYGKSYGSLRSLTGVLGATLAYDSVKKQFIVTRGETTLRLTPEKSGYLLNGNYYATDVPSTIRIKGSLLIQLDVLTNAFADYSGYDGNKNAVVISYYSSPTDKPSSKPAPKPKNEAPHAYFETDKTTYKIGEPITYKQLSSDDKGITNSEWYNKQRAYFKPGKHTVKLTVWDAEGLTDSYYQNITVVDDVLYTEEEFNKRFTYLGDAFPINSSAVLDLPTIGGEIEETGHNVVRVNSPEQITGEYLHYQYTLSGKQRFAIHKQNGLKKPIQLHFTVHNPSNRTTTVTISRYGAGGPYQYIYQVGKLAVQRYLENIDRPLNKKIVLKPGETKSLLVNTSQTLMPKDTVTIYADIESNIPVKYEVATAYSKTPDSKISRLPIAERDELHNRGHFFRSEKQVTVNENVGTERQRMIIGDGKVDTFQRGYDPFSNRTEFNAGNHGMLYTVDLMNVEPNTLITINPRGGSYAGSFYVNGKIVNATTNGLLKGPAEAGVLYRTGDAKERVQIKFMAAAGSNMPINLIFEPLNTEKKEETNN